MSADPWSGSSRQVQLTEEKLDALAAAADKAMAEGAAEYLAANPLDPEIAELVDFVFADIGEPAPPYGFPERAAYDLSHGGGDAR